MNARLTFIQALSSLHPGTGQGAGVIDLPVAREAATGIPYLPGSSLKGVLRDQCGDDAQCEQLFGPKSDSITNANAHAGAALFSDQRLLLFPVRSLAGTFAWVTSPFVLKRFRRDCLNIGLTPEPPEVKSLRLLKTARVPEGSVLSIKIKKKPDVIIFEDLDMVPRISPNAKKWAEWLKERLFPCDEGWQHHFEKRFCIVHDDLFSFLLETATEVTARNKLDENKTSENLWYEEALPAETFLQGIVVGQQVGSSGMVPDDVLNAVAGLTAVPLRLGGNTSVGRGLCRIIMEG